MAEGGGVEIRTFLSLQEIQEVQGFAKDAVFTKEDYASLIGDYRLPERLRCCLRTEKRERCPAKHNFGFVLRLKDGTATLVGNQCGNDQFGAESDLAKDRKSYLKEKERQEALKRLRELLSARAATEAAVAQQYEQLRDLCSRSTDWLLAAGLSATQRIKSLARDDRAAVSVQGVRSRKYVEDGRTKEERTTIEIAVGSLSGLTIFNRELVWAIHGDLRRVSEAFRGAEALSESATTNVLKHAVARLTDVDGVLARGRAVLDAETAFQNSDWSCLPFLVKDGEERRQLASLALQQKGASPSKAKAKARAYLAELEASLRARYGVERIEIL